VEKHVNGKRFLKLRAGNNKLINFLEYGKREEKK